MRINQTYRSLLTKFVNSMLSAIEIYNKPNFSCRGETFAILATNAIELLFNVKILKLGYLLSENKTRWTTYHLNTAYSPSSTIDNISNDDTSNDDTLKVKEVTPLQKKIIEECTLEYISIEEIAIKVKKSVSQLKNRVITEMVKNGFLIRLHPKTNHPEQKYISKK